MENSSEIEGSATLTDEAMKGVRNELSITTARTYLLSVRFSLGGHEDCTVPEINSQISIVGHVSRRIGSRMLAIAGRAHSEGMGHSTGRRSSMGKS